MLPRYVTFALVLAASTLVRGVSFAQPSGFTEMGIEAGLLHRHGELGGRVPPRHLVSAGVAVGDFNADGLPDLFFDAGAGSPSALYRNLGGGAFEECAAEMGVALRDATASAPLFADVNGDGRDDLLLGSLTGGAVRVFVNAGDGGFAEATERGGIRPEAPTFSICAGDFDRDGDLDLYTSHWQTNRRPNSLWRNDGRGGFTSADAEMGLFGAFGPVDYDFAANFADVNGDGWPDLLVAADFGTSHVWFNRGGERFELARETLFTDENGMGAALGDYDNDGDIDWYVSSIFDADGVNEGDWGTTGARLYANRGDGTFEDVPAAGGAGAVGWGWGASFGDLDADGLLDLVVANGWPDSAQQFRDDSLRVFIAHRADTSAAPAYADRAGAFGVVDTAQGRGVSLVDYDGDGDLDILVANYGSRPHLYRNDLPGAARTIRVRPGAPLANDLGARVQVHAAGIVQTRWVRGGSNYASQNPPELVFGLGAAQRADSVTAVWPDGRTAWWGDVGPGAVLSLASGTSRADAAVPASASAWSLFPNPAPGAAAITVLGPAGGTVTLRDVNGRRVGGSASEVIGDGVRRYCLATDTGAALPSGWYAVEFCWATGGAEVGATACGSRAVFIE